MVSSGVMKNESMLQVAEAFFDACESGKGWAGCRAYCAPDASFAAQSEPLLGIATLEGYTDWMKGITTVFPDGHYELKAFAEDAARSWVVAFAVFHATHTGEGGPVPPTGKSMSTDYVYAMQFADGKIVHMTKVWNSGLALKAVGWA
jgi:predicted ester cyclase